MKAKRFTTLLVSSVLAASMLVGCGGINKNETVATLDGRPAELARADYILRTMYVPAGQHTIEMRFDPTSLHVTEGIAYGALALLVIGIIVAVLTAKRKYVKA